MDEWANFFLGELGASAALAGLLFVAMAQNQEQILKLGRMADRGLESLIMLFLALVSASLPLIPRQADHLLGGEIAVVGAAVLAVTLRLQQAYVMGVAEVYLRSTRWMIRVNRLAVAMIAISGVAIALVSGDSGLRILAPGLLLCLCAAAANAWVLLVEINR